MQLFDVEYLPFEHSHALIMWKSRFHHSHKKKEPLYEFKEDIIYVPGNKQKIAS